MGKFITIYVPIAKYVKTATGEDHIIDPCAVAISRETYDSLCDTTATNIKNKVKPIVDDLNNLIDSLNRNEFTCEFDQNSVIIYHDYCPTLDKDHVTGSGKDYKNLNNRQKIELLKTRYIEIIKDQINHRLQQAHDIIEDFEYHPIQIEMEELEKMNSDTIYSETDLVEFDNTDPMDSEVEQKAEFMDTVVTDPHDPYDNPIDHMDR